MTRHKQRRKVSKAQIFRSVASSSAIETGKPVKVIEAELKAHKTKRQELQLAF